MTIDELLASYDPADLEYDEWFGYETENKANHLFSFIPTKEECEEIFLINELKQLLARRINEISKSRID